MNPKSKIQEKYYLIIDNATQWFQNAIAVDSEDKIHSNICVDFKINGPFLNSIYEREVHFWDRSFLGQSCYGWTISKKEFETIKRLVELYPQYMEYIKTI